MGDIANQVTYRNTHARIEDQRERGFNIGQILDQIMDDLAAGPQRWPVVRTGEREPIPWPMRLSIYKRDGGVCRICGRSDALELDHCMPWSAGGPDDSDNLRVLCQPCNTRRSNFKDYAHHTHLRPTTWWCEECWTEDAQRPRMPWRDGTDLNLVPLVENPAEQVYCAWCDFYSFSDLYFAGDIGRRLLAQIQTGVTA